MAVAAHVSRVAKEYAPFGYSIMSDVSIAYGRLAGSESNSGAVAHTIADHTTPVNVALLPADDADVYIESVHIWIGAKVGAHNANDNFEFRLKRGDNDGNLANSVELVSAGAGKSHEIPATTLVNIGVDQNQVVPKGKVLFFEMKEDGDVSALALDGLCFFVRYRRKA
tara:strand:- start:28 stop:531 length:504 start_codon:yes stop_codon:yes gene_type:complete